MPKALCIQIQYLQCQLECKAFQLFWCLEKGGLLHIQHLSYTETSRRTFANEYHNNDIRERITTSEFHTSHEEVLMQVSLFVIIKETSLFSYQGPYPIELSIGCNRKLPTSHLIHKDIGIVTSTR